jgi:8-oxo-dGTP pyrophosphatase MutT (NUDIX family)
MSHESSIHKAQTIILRELLFIPAAKFTVLQKATSLESDHVKFHLARLVDLGYISKSDSGYTLTIKGKEYANKLDTDKNEIERQPKSAVILVIENKEGHFLFQERIKHPYYGFWGFPGGKIRWGETILQAGARELYEETGLVASLIYKGVYHEHVVSEDGTIIEDKIFHIIHADSPKGTLIESFEGGHNEWSSYENIFIKGPTYKSIETEYLIGLGKESFIELTQTYTDQEF